MVGYYKWKKGDNMNILKLQKCFIWLLIFNNLYFPFFWYEFQVTDASVRKMEYCAIVGAIALDHVITNDF